MYLAMPSSVNRNGSKEFPTLQEASKFLNSVCEPYVKFSIGDWCIIGKIKEVDENGQLSSVPIDMKKYL